MTNQPYSYSFPASAKSGANTLFKAGMMATRKAIVAEQNRIGFEALAKYGIDLFEMRSRCVLANTSHGSKILLIDKKPIVEFFSVPMTFDEQRYFTVENFYRWLD